jgi:hypothetical protein
MEKPKTLRAALMETIPSLAENPDLFWMEITEGQLIGHNFDEPSGFSWAYTLELTFIDTVEQPARIAFVITQWAAKNQPDLLTASGIPFAAPRVDSDKVDLVFRLRLREIMALVDDGAGGQALQSQPEPDMDALFSSGIASGTLFKSATSIGVGRTAYG